MISITFSRSLHPTATTSQWPAKVPSAEPRETALTAEACRGTEHQRSNSWYWLADACASAGIKFVLGHALYMKAIHGTKSKNDRVDSEKIAHLLRSNLLPEAYTCRPEPNEERRAARRAAVSNANGKFDLFVI